VRAVGGDGAPDVEEYVRRIWWQGLGRELGEEGGGARSYDEVVREMREVLVINMSSV